MIKYILLAFVCFALFSCHKAANYAPAVSKGEKYFGKKAKEKDEFDRVLESIED